MIFREIAIFLLTPQIFVTSNISSANKLCFYPRTDMPPEVMKVDLILVVTKHMIAFQPKKHNLNTHIQHLYEKNQNCLDVIDYYHILLESTVEQLAKIEFTEEITSLLKDMLEQFTLLKKTGKQELQETVKEILHDNKVLRTTGKDINALHDLNNFEINLTAFTEYYYGVISEDFHANLVDAGILEAEIAISTEEASNIIELHSSTEVIMDDFFFLNLVFSYERMRTETCSKTNTDNELKNFADYVKIICPALLTLRRCTRIVRLTGIDADDKIDCYIRYAEHLSEGRDRAYYQKQLLLLLIYFNDMFLDSEEMNRLRITHQKRLMIVRNGMSVL